MLCVLHCFFTISESNEFEIDDDNLFFRDLISLSSLRFTLKEIYKEAFGEEVDEPLADSVNGVNDAKIPLKNLLDVAESVFEAEGADEDE